MTTNDNENYAKLCSEFYCHNCDYNTSKKSSYINHLNSKKHNLCILTTENNANYAKLCSKTYNCENCEKLFNDRSGLWRHKKKCITNIEINKIQDTNDKDKLIMMLITQNSDLIKETSEFKNMMMKVVENGTNNTINNNSNNKSFNLHFFLNETCKDAMNITDFVDSIKLQLCDLEKVGEIGYVNGISNIIVKNLNALDITQRPVHCTDKKREIIYIKDENKWEKEDDEMIKMRKVIKKVADKNARLLPKFKEAHPDCIKSSSPFSDQYNKIIVESMGGSGNNDIEKEEKIIKTISKQIIVDK